MNPYETLETQEIESIQTQIAEGLKTTNGDTAPVTITARQAEILLQAHQKDRAAKKAMSQGQKAPAPNPPPKRIVCAAMLMDDQLIVPGVRHFSNEMREVLRRIYGKGYHLRVVEQGFIDTHGNFLSREEAWKRAEATGQILRDCGTTGELYSENLY